MRQLDRYDLDRSKRPNMWIKFDYILFITVVGLTLLGLIILPSALSGQRDASKAVIVQIGCFIVGVGIAIFLSCIDYIVFKHIAVFFYFGNIVAMLLVYSPLGKEVNGSLNWLDLGIITYQPSELLKLATIIMVAMCLEDMKLDSGRTLYNVGRIGFFFALPMVMVLLQKDLGTALVFVFFFTVMIFVAGLKLRYFISAISAALISIPFIWKFYLSKDSVRSERILTFLDPERDPMNKGFQARMAKYSIGSGQTTGKGIGNGPITSAGSVPIKESDFIFSVIGEELGFIGSIMVVGLFFILLTKMIGISRKAADYFGEYVSIGIFSMFAFHFLENIGMNIGIMPITGIPLPFISAGGSAILTNFLAIGVVLSISARRRTEGLFGEMN